MSGVPYVDCNSAASGSCPTGTLLSMATGYMLGSGSSGAYDAGLLGLYDALFGWSACCGIMYVSIVVQALLNGVQLPVTAPYVASSQSQKLYASEVVSCP
jgi:hypothetical protein